ncbi:MAG: SphA family protein [Gammaproteobacteria bacterium]|jgi:hypothetical protein
MNTSTQYRNLKKIIFMITILGSASNIQAADVVQLPAVNLGDTSFVDGIAGPGTLVKVLGNHFSANRFTDVNGNSLPGDNKLEANALLGQYAYISKTKILGGFYGAEVLLPLVDIEPDTTLTGLPNTGERGFGDLIVSPFLLQWTDHKIFGRPYFHRLNFVFLLPTGSYDADNQVNTGSNIFSFNPYYAGTYFLTKKLTTSFRLHYLWNSENDRPLSALNVDDTQPGTAFHMNYAASYALTKKLRIGVAGYYLNQLSEDEINGISQANSEEKTFAIGPGLQYHHKNNFLNINYYFESGAENRPEGHRIVAWLAWVFH